MIKETIYKIDGGETFEGTLAMFQNCFFSNATPELIKCYCDDNGWELEIVIG